MVGSAELKKYTIPAASLEPPPASASPHYPGASEPKSLELQCRGCQPSICRPWQEGGRISRPHLRQGKAEVSHARQEAKSSATMKLAGIVSPQTDPAVSSSKIQEAGMEDRPATLQSEGGLSSADPKLPLRPLYTRSHSCKPQARKDVCLSPILQTTPHPAITY